MTFGMAGGDGGFCLGKEVYWKGKPVGGDEGKSKNGRSPSDTEI